MISLSFDFFVVKDYAICKMRRCGNSVVDKIAHAEPGSTPPDVAKIEANEPPKLTLGWNLVFTVDQLGSGPLSKLGDENAATTEWGRSAFLLASTVEEMDT
jgi:hypothetical protein